ncbi:MAG: agmatine deiminase family protein [Myxococcales bacterium]|nr:agmatine deiminase family protein [Myxococcales bacterium]
MKSGLRMPAEWEPHRAMWLAMPHDEVEWGDYFADARESVCVLANALATSEPVHLLVSEDGPPLPLHASVSCHVVPYGDIWLRDTGPVFVARGETMEAASFAFNGWGGKYMFEHDSEVAERIARLAKSCLRPNALVAEGGALECNGVGTFLSTRECLLNENRNPGQSEADIEQALAEALGCRKVIWLERGLTGDHTDGHVDNLARFVAPAKVLCMEPSSHDDPNSEILREVRQTLEAAKTWEGEPIELITIPSPGRIEGPTGLMAASYCNFLIANQCLVVPTFGVPNDAKALATLSTLFPARRIVPLNALALLTGGGTVHCISQQEPSHV